jgi:hypothetical protein
LKHLIHGWSSDGIIRKALLLKPQVGNWGLGFQAA